MPAVSSAPTHDVPSADPTELLTPTGEPTPVMMDHLTTIDDPRHVHIPFRL